MAVIMVIDDEEMVRTTLRDTLELDGHEVVEASDGQKGLDMFAVTPANLVITDIMMPEKAGIETVVELSQQFPATKIIVISGGGVSKNLEFLKIAKTLGADRVIPKPFTPDRLLTTVRELLAA